MKDYEIAEMIQEAAKNGMAVAELEYLGLSIRTINTLECSKFKCVFLDSLVKLSSDDLNSIKNLGDRGKHEIAEALRRFPELEEIRKRWRKGSDRLEFYKARIPSDSYILR